MVVNTVNCWSQPGMAGKVNGTYSLYPWQASSANPATPLPVLIRFWIWCIKANRRGVVPMCCNKYAHALAERSNLIIKQKQENRTMKKLITAALLLAASAGMAQSNLQEKRLQYAKIAERGIKAEKEAEAQDLFKLDKSAKYEGALIFARNETYQLGHENSADSIRKEVMLKFQKGVTESDAYITAFYDLESTE